MFWKKSPQSNYKITIFSWKTLMFEPISVLCVYKLSNFYTIRQEIKHMQLKKVSPMCGFTASCTVIGSQNA